MTAANADYTTLAENRTAYQHCFAKFPVSHVEKHVTKETLLVNLDFPPGLRPGGKRFGLRSGR